MFEGFESGHCLVKKLPHPEGVALGRTPSFGDYFHGGGGGTVLHCGGTIQGGGPGECLCMLARQPPGREGGGRHETSVGVHAEDSFCVCSAGLLAVLYLGWVSNTSFSRNWSLRMLETVYPLLLCVQSAHPPTHPLEVSHCTVMPTGACAKDYLVPPPPAVCLCPGGIHN